MGNINSFSEIITEITQEKTEKILLLAIIDVIDEPQKTINNILYKCSLGENTLSNVDSDSLNSAFESIDNVLNGNLGNNTIGKINGYLTTILQITSGTNRQHLFNTAIKNLLAKN